MSASPLNLARRRKTELKVAAESWFTIGRSSFRPRGQNQQIKHAQSAYVPAYDVPLTDPYHLPRHRTYLESNDISGNESVSNLLNASPSPVKRRMRAETPSKRISARISTKRIINGIKIEPESDLEEVLFTSPIERNYTDPLQPLRRSSRRSVKEEPRLGDEDEQEDEEEHDSNRVLGVLQNGNGPFQNGSKDDSFPSYVPEVHDLDADVVNANLAAVISSRINGGWSSARKTMRIGHMWGLLKRAQKRASNARTIVYASLLLEFAVFLTNAIPWTYHLIVGPTQYYLLSDPVTHDLYLPDFFVLLTWPFWRPFLLYLGLLLVAPLTASFLVNFEPRRATYSPLTFSVVKLVTAFYATNHWQLLNDTFANVPATLVLIDAAVGVVYSIYEAIVVRK
ncbi:hypothetical protein BC936DRAFT_146913 [Jimgerdemannia flammicorona]|uniref:Uncharacterized protein n=1 Tax=Jimgerdemannia flammicorona TaxID=994334 RepID=A0A433D6M1_9FUNG|nr:hypothetical protein BC936DRAFT_146913 [Jimgerdemannia flammicorona]